MSFSRLLPMQALTDLSAFGSRVVRRRRHRNRGVASRRKLNAVSGNAGHRNQYRNECRGAKRNVLLCRTVFDADAKTQPEDKNTSAGASNAQGTFIGLQKGPVS